MSYKAHIEVIISFNQFFLHNCKKQCNLRFRVFLFARPKQQLENQKQSPRQYFKPYTIDRCSRPCPQLQQKRTSIPRQFASPNLFKKALCQNIRGITNEFQPRIIKGQNYFSQNKYNFRESSHSMNRPCSQFYSSAIQSHARTYREHTQQRKKKSEEAQSYIDNENECYYSRIFESRRMSNAHFVGECCWFRGTISTEKIDQMELVLRVQLLQALDNTNESFQKLNQFQGVITNTHSNLTYLPIVFDSFQGQLLNGVYQSALLQFKFQPHPQFPKINSFANYLQAVTNELKKEKTKYFYDYYHNFLTDQLINLQMDHEALLRALNLQIQYYAMRPQPLPFLYEFINNVLEDQFGAVYRVGDAPVQCYSEVKRILSEDILKAMLQLKAMIHQRLCECNSVVKDCLPEVTLHLKQKYDQVVKDRFRHHVFSHCIEPNFNYTFSRYEDSGKLMSSSAAVSQFQTQPTNVWREDFPIYNKIFFQDPIHYVKIFQEVFDVQSKTIQSIPSRKNGIHLSQLNASTVTTDNPYRKYIEPNKRKQTEHFLRAGQGQHIIFCVHGYQASKQDFNLFKTCLQIRYKAKVFMSGVNEGRTDDSMEIMGKRLAIQILNFMEGVQVRQSTRISFVGHSMGGIVIRAALTHLPNLIPNLYTYMSFSSPHLAYLYEPSLLVRAGLWLLSRTTSSFSLKEMTMKDTDELRDTYLYNLTKNQALDPFVYLALISSGQDQYVPFESARVEKNMLLLTGDLNHSPNRAVICEMVDNLIGNARAQEISRINVVFNIEKINFDSIVGRTAHIKYLSDHTFIKIFCIVFDKFFL